MIKIKTSIPGPKSTQILHRMKQINGGWSDPLPFVHSHKGKGCYFKDVDGNKFLDFASQIAANPLGYNHKRLLKVVKKYKQHPLKYAGQDFYTKEHIEMIEEIISITKNKNAAFLVNSGAEAVENALKISMYNQKSSKFGISFRSGFHGRTIGALSCTNSQAVHKNRFLQLPMRRLPYDITAAKELKRILEQEAKPEDVGFVIIEPIQGEGGYRIPNHTMMREISNLCNQKNIPLVADEVQAGVGRSGKWWAHEHFDFQPTVISSAKAMQIGAVIAKKDFFPEKVGTISSTWGGGSIIDLAIGRETIRTIKEEKLLNHNRKMGDYLLQQVNTLPTQNVRGLGLMCAFDVPTTKMRNNLVLQLIKQGVAILACGTNGVRMIPPYIVTEKEIDEFVLELDKAIKKCKIKGFKHKGKVCEFTGC